jgi:hypothetical protein
MDSKCVIVSFIIYYVYKLRLGFDVFACKVILIISKSGDTERFQVFPRKHLEMKFPIFPSFFRKNRKWKG